VQHRLDRGSWEPQNGGVQEQPRGDDCVARSDRPEVREQGVLERVRTHVSELVGRLWGAQEREGEAAAPAAVAVLAVVEQRGAVV
jgi:hypothetical protein